MVFESSIAGAGTQVRLMASDRSWLFASREAPNNLADAWGAAYLERGRTQ